MDIFRWAPREGMQVSTKPNVTVVTFGDGYEQRRPAGLNSQLKSYSPTFRAIGDEQVAALERFLSRHGGVTAFLWRPPKVNRTIKVVCREWSMSSNVLYSDFSCKFDEVVA